MILNFFFFLSLFRSGTATFSSQTFISFKSEEQKIMTEFNSLNSLERVNNGLFYNKDFKNCFEPMLKLDGIEFFREMRKVRNKIFLFIFWTVFQSSWIFLCDSHYIKNTKREFKDFIAGILNTGWRSLLAKDLLYHFKIHLMQLLATYQGEKDKMLIEAKNFYTFQLKDLILDLLHKSLAKELRSQIKEMNQNFRFYYQCIEKDNLKSVFIREFYKFKFFLKSATNEQVNLCMENMAFLAGILIHDRSTIFGLTLISDQSPELVGYFLLAQRRRKSFLKRKLSISDANPKQYRKKFLTYLFEKIPIFEEHQKLTMFTTSPQKYKVLDNFPKIYEDILSKDQLIELAITLAEKILRLQI
jgi:hypothetical protein